MNQQDREKKQIFSENVAMLGLCMGDYQIVSFCAQGSVAATFRATNSSGKVVAVKILQKSSAAEYFLARSKKITELSNPTIARVYEIAFEPQINAYYVASQWIEGRTLEQILEKQIALEDAVAIILHVSRAIAYAHEQGVGHGNLKPSNILFTAEGEAFVADFGLVPLQQEHGRPPSLTMLDYMAPEQFQGILPTYATDIYSVGCLFWQLIAGKLPERKAGKFPDISSALQAAKVEVPAGVTACLEKMLALEPEKRSLCLSELESLYLSVQKVVCPICGKKNTMKEVFNCYECESQNLCLSHLVAERQCCQKCNKQVQASATQRMLKPSAKNRPKLIGFLNHIQTQQLFGVLVLGCKDAVLGMHITPTEIELCTEKNPPGNVPADEAFYAELVRFFGWKEFSFEFWENKTPERILPQNKGRIIMMTSPARLFPSLSRLLQIWNEFQKEGGLFWYGNKLSAGVLFAKKGIVLTCPAPVPGQAVATVKGKVALWTLKSLLRSPWTKIEYRPEWAFPDTQNYVALPMEDLAKAMPKPGVWKTLSERMPTLQTLLPPTLHWNQPFGGLDLSRLRTTVSEKLFNALKEIDELIPTSLTPLTGLLLKASIVKERFYEVSDLLVNMAQNHYDKWPTETTETILLQAKGICPEHPEVSQLLGEFYEYVGQTDKAALHYAQAGDVHWQNKDNLRAAACYQQVVDLKAEMVLPMLRLIEHYEQTNQRDKIGSIGEATWNAWQKMRDSNKELTMDTIENLCQLLAKYDCAPNACREEWCNILVAKGKAPLAIKQYETLIENYRKEKNRSAQIRSIASILQLDPKRTDLVDKIEKMHGKDWKKLWVKKSAMPYATPPPKTSGINGDIVKICFTHSRSLQLATVAAIILLMVTVVLPMYAGPEVPLPQTFEAPAPPPPPVAVKPVPKPAEQPEETKVSQRELQDLWDRAAQLKQAEKYAPAKDYCEKILTTGDAAWKEKATKEIEELDRLIQKEPILHQQQAFLDEAVSYKEKGLYPDARRMYNKAHGLDPTTAAAKEAELGLQWIQTRELEAEKYRKTADIMIQEKDYAKAVERLSLLVEDPAWKHCKASQGIEIPLLVETSPVSATYTVDSGVKQEKVGKALLVFRRPPREIPEVKVNREGFSEAGRIPFLTDKGQLWKVQIELNYVPLWQFPAQGKLKGFLDGPMTVDKGTLYCGCGDGHIYALTLDGKEMWNFDAGRLETISGGVLLDQNTIYFGSHNGYAYAIEPNTGKLRWKVLLEAGKADPSPVRSTPCRSGPYICFATENGKVWFVTDDDRQTRWEFSLQDKCHGSPAPYGKDGKVVVANRKGLVYGVSPEKKNSLWKKQLKGNPAAGPVVAKNQIYFATEKGEIAALSDTGDIKWTVSLKARARPTLAAGPDYLYAADANGGIYCLAQAQGKQKWQSSVSGAVSFLHLHGNVLYVATDTPALAAFAADTGEVKWNHKIKKTLESPPLVVKGVLLSGTKEGILYAYSLDAE